MRVADKNSSKRITRKKNLPTGKSRSVTAKKQRSGARQMTAAREMAAHGITRVPVDYFHLGAFRYTNLNDALAQAKRTLQD